MAVDGIVDLSCSCVTVMADFVDCLDNEHRLHNCFLTYVAQMERSNIELYILIQNLRQIVMQLLQKLTLSLSMLILLQVP
jgi:hypothetical protein